MLSQKRGAMGYIALFLIFCLIFTALIGGFAWLGTSLSSQREKVPAEDASAAARPIIVIDAGHGGEDGGASGEDGTKEKDLNLLVAQALSDILTAVGYDVRMTRTNDCLLYDLYGDLTDYTGHKKTYDLRNRLRFTKEAGADLLISIHMNSYPDEAVYGLQVFYKSGDEVSKKIAAIAGLAAGEIAPQAAVVRCQGNSHNAGTKLVYSGVKSCKMATQLFGGPKNCVHGCIGFGDCVEVCPYEAIFICDGVARINPEEDVMMITSSGTIIRTAISGIKEMGRATQGVILMKTAKDEKLVSIATAEHEEEAEAIDGTEIVEAVEETTEE